MQEDARMVFPGTTRLSGFMLIARAYFNICYRAVFHYRLAHSLLEADYPRILAFWLSQRARSKYAIEISPHASIGKGFRIIHGVGVVIGEHALIGDYFTVYHGVTIGSRDRKGVNVYPTIGNSVTVYPGSQILGGIRIGDNCVVGANSTVLSDIPEGWIAVGSPARAIRQNTEKVA